MVTINQFIVDIIESNYSDKSISRMVLNTPLVNYLNKKTASVNRGAKSRGSFANLYAIYVLVEDYIKNGFLNSKKDYSKYAGADFTPLFNRQRELPFGEKLQNHALNHRCNAEFSKYYPELGKVPIIHDTKKGKYWINETLLYVNDINIAKNILQIIDTYIELKRENFNSFFDECLHYQKTYTKDSKTAINFIKQQLAPNVDARIFEIVSYCIVKYRFNNETVYFGKTADTIKECPINVYKTGRTNANDGGIDFIMQPLGRVFQVTEELSFKKYFLDIDKLNRYPITFVVKTTLTPKQAFERITKDASALYGLNSETYQKYIDCFEELITIPTLLEYLNVIIQNNDISGFFEELVIQCKVEYNITD